MGQRRRGVVSPLEWRVQARLQGLAMAEEGPLRCRGSEVSGFLKDCVLFV
ncbi:hypothetical protein Sjap_008896 [Stephania japonica]|uniref:Uncharacterized protein n=1 Tax=Stephania japonica TaxID=461633 RepID=A0AAP0JSU7_9MAGN